MRRLFAAPFWIALAVLPGCASAQGGNTNPSNMHCAMMSDTGAMAKEMHAMMSDMDDMMKATGDQPLKNRMQKMRGQMTDMTAKMEKHGMGMMESGPTQPEDSTGSTSPAAEDHKAHH